MRKTNVIVTPTPDESFFATQLQKAAMKKMQDLTVDQITEITGVCSYGVKALLADNAWSINVALRVASVFGIVPTMDIPDE